jgi:2-oxo-4-hydroxy-4-carboxy-5-ureidoimidazoline decarboxylase
MSLKTLNDANRDAAELMLQQCCTSQSGVLRMLDGRPFNSRESVFSQANQAWLGLKESDYLQAFDGHPKIGDVSSLKEKYANTKALASGEQSGVGSASDLTIETLAQGNTDYERKFGFIFIVCASGKSAEEMSDLLQARIGNSREEELINAAEEQRKIFQLRLEKLL